MPLGIRHIVAMSMQWWAWVLVGLLADTAIEALMELELLNYKILATSILAIASTLAIRRYLARPTDSAPMSSSLMYRLECWFSNVKWAKPIALLGASSALVLLVYTTLDHYLGDSVAHVGV